MLISFFCWVNWGPLPHSNHHVFLEGIFSTLCSSIFLHISSCFLFFYYCVPPFFNNFCSFLLIVSIIEIPHITGFKCKVFKSHALYLAKFHFKCHVPPPWLECRKLPTNCNTILLQSLFRICICLTALTIALNHFRTYYSILHFFPWPATYD